MSLDRQASQNAPWRCTWEAWDANEHAHNLTDWSQEYDQFSRGAFYGRIDEVRLSEMQVFKEYTSNALGQQCNVWPESLWIGIPVDGQSCRINGHQVGAQEVMCQPGGHDFELVTPDRFGIYGLVVSRQWLTRAGAADDLLAADPERLMRLQLPDHTRQATGFLIERLLGTQREQLSVKVHQDILSLALAEILREETPNTEMPPSYGHRKQVVDRIKAHLNACEAPPVALSELCEIAHVSQRTLQYSFNSILGISPIQFLRLTRLNRVRRRLSAPDTGTTVSQVAADWGFYHLGQFAQDYRQLFGEAPSVTLYRHAA
ncbi:AraC family ethanolamine operon transcriptional activator [Onishia taeanensis]|uniref:AraC family ethanolamine operon transcriptional activator n=1 Tax=Onishia taeanensis TaxID=284577 RepID=A0A328Y141_9GAMM|nr:helix-turn-helix domain-containing protein [Halomonas taeanensis]RAR62044.1 AraC family ethanolamine operon transcriptional activator [Halomonas taeanensis]